MRKLLSVASFIVVSAAFAQEEPFFRLFDIQLSSGGYFTQRIDLQNHDWHKLNPDGFPQQDNSFSLYSHHSGGPVQGGNMRTLQAQFAIRKKNPANKGLWIGGLMIGGSSGTYAREYWQHQSDYYVLDTVSYASGAPSQLLMGDTINQTWRTLRAKNAHLGVSFGYTTNPSRLFSFKVRALLDFSVSVSSTARFTGLSNYYTGVFTSLDQASQESTQLTSATQPIGPGSSTYSTQTIVGVGFQIPVGISWQLSSFRPILSRFSLGMELAGGVRMISVPRIGTYSVPTFSIGANFAYRFKTWIPDKDNIRKIRENQKMGQGMR